MNNKTKTEWRLVPVEPTKEMQKIALSVVEDAFGVATYKAMLNAAPTPPASEPCERCAELEGKMDFWRDNAKEMSNKLAALEAENARVAALAIKPDASALKAHDEALIEWCAEVCEEHQGSAETCAAAIRELKSKL